MNVNGYAEEWHRDEERIQLLSKSPTQFAKSAVLKLARQHKHHHSSASSTRISNRIGTSSHDSFGRLQDP
jgi:hypothetical protein